MTLDDLVGHGLIHNVPALGGCSPPVRMRGAGERLADSFPANGQRTKVNNSDAYPSACLAGLGIVQLPANGVRQYPDDRSLIEILPGYRPAPMRGVLVYANRRHLQQRVQVFMARLRSLIGAPLAD